MNLKKTIAFWEQVMSSVAFAEENEHEFARYLLKNKGKSNAPDNNETLKNVHKNTLSHN